MSLGSDFIALLIRLLARLPCVSLKFERFRSKCRRMVAGFPGMTGQARKNVFETRRVLGVLVLFNGKGGQRQGTKTADFILEMSYF